MKIQLSRDVNVLIIEDDHYYNDLLANRIKQLNNKPDIKNRFRLQVRQVFKPEQFLTRQERQSKSNNCTIAFVDYYLGSENSGLQVSDRLADMNENVKIVIMSQSEEIISELDKTRPPANLYTNIVKHEYTPEICSIIVENYINNL